jgi:hypothetical protein
MEGDHVSWLYPARSDAPQGRWQLSEVTPRMRLKCARLNRHPNTDLLLLRPDFGDAAFPVVAGCPNQASRLVA